MKNSVEVDGLLSIPGQFKKAMEERTAAAYYRFKTPLTEEEQNAAEFLAGVLSTAIDAVEDVYFQAVWYPGEDEAQILGLLVEYRDEEDEPEPGVDADSPEGKAIIQAIAKAFDLDPALLGDAGDEPVEDEPVEDVIWNGTGSGSVVVE